MPRAKNEIDAVKTGFKRESFAGVKLGKASLGESFAGVRLGFRFSTELQTAARTILPKRGRMNRGGTSAPLADELYQLEVRLSLRLV